MNRGVALQRSGPPSAPASEIGWDERAQCRDVADPEVFFPPSGLRGAYEPAKRICWACPVGRQCLAEAMRQEGSSGVQNRFGVRGGLDPEERTSLYRLQHRKAKAGAR